MKYFLFLVLPVFLLISCQQSSPNTGGGSTIQTDLLVDPAIQIPSFNADTAFNLIQKQLDFGPRVPNTEGHVACANWIINRMEAYGTKVAIQAAQINNWDGQILNIQNIIASINPDRAKRIMISAHWDSRPVADQDDNEEFHDDPIPGANDAGSGVAVMMEMARVMAMDSSLNVGVDFFFWDAEDGGKSNIQDSYCLGSQYWVKNPVPPNYRPVYGINLDMVGGKDARFTQEGQSVSYAPKVVKNVWNTASKLGHGRFFSPLKSDGIIDDHLYINRAGIPMIDIIDNQPGHDVSFFEHWHTMKDDMDHISTETLKAVGQTVMTVIYNDQ